MEPVARAQRLFRRSTQLRLTIFFFLPIIPLILVSLYAMSQSEKIVFKQAGESNEAAMESSLGLIDQFTETVQRLSLQISSDSTLNGMLDIRGSESTMIYQASLIWDRLTMYGAADESIADIWILDANLGMLISRKHGGRRIDYENRDWYLDALTASGSSVLHVPSGSVYSELSDTVDNGEFVTFTREMGFKTQGTSPHIVGIAVPRDTFLQFGRGLLNTAHSQLQIQDAEGRTIASYGGQPDGASEPASRRTAAIPHKKMLNNRVVSERTGWTIELAQPESALTRDSEKLQAFIILISGLSLIMALTVSWFVYIGISSPLSKLIHGIRQVRRGVWDVKLENKRQDEFGILTETFNQMAAQQQQYLQDIYTQQVQKTRTELKFLQSQINPHFLYNTLDSIYASAIHYGAEETGEMVLNLSRFFRLSLSKGKDTFTVQETIEHLSYYVRIQQLRFLDHFEWEYRIAEAAKPIPILKLLLQPLVENAIIHGLEKAPPGGKLTIVADIDSDFLVLSVRDTGSGIPAERLRQIQAELERSQADAFHLENAQPHDFYGLTNVCSRLKLFYGSQAELSIDSMEGLGTETTIRIPLDACDALPELARDEEERP